MTPKELIEHIDSLSTCCLGSEFDLNNHPSLQNPFKEEDIEGIVYRSENCSCGPAGSDKDCGSYCGRSGIVVAKLKDGRYITVLDSQDTSGHGCQCGSDLTISSSYGDMVSLALTDEWRQAFLMARRD